MESAGSQRLSGSSGYPPRRPSPAVYRRRRLVAAILALLVIAGLAVGAKFAADALGGNTPAAKAGPAPAARETASAAPSKPAPAAKCDEKSVSVEAVTDAGTYGRQQKPAFTLVVRNDGDAPCKVNVGTSQMEFQVTSASDRIFSSVDCQDGSEDLLKDIAPGAEEKASFTWDRIRSMPGCEAVEAAPGPGTYTLTTKLGSRTSPPATFVLE